MRWSKPALASLSILFMMAILLPPVFAQSTYTLQQGPFQGIVEERTTGSVFVNDFGMNLAYDMETVNGATITDFSPGRNDGILSGPSNASGSFGGSLDFDGADDYISISTNLSSPFGRFDSLSDNMMFTPPGTGSADRPFIIEADGIFYAFAEVRSDTGETFDIWLSTSTDLVTWTEYVGNPVLNKTDVPFGGGYVADPSILLIDGTYYMWFDAKDSGAGIGETTMGRATSPDLYVWTVDPITPVKQPGVGGWDSLATHAPEVFLHDGELKMLYSGASTVYEYQGGLATSSDNGETWVNYPTNPVIPFNIAPNTSKQARPGQVIPYEGLLIAPVDGKNDAGDRVSNYWVVSEDAESWSILADANVNPTGDWSNFFISGNLISYDGSLYAVGEGEHSSLGGRRSAGVLIESEIASPSAALGFTAALNLNMAEIKEQDFTQKDEHHYFGMTGGGELRFRFYESGIGWATEHLSGVTLASATQYDLGVTYDGVAVRMFVNGTRIYSNSTDTGKGLPDNSNILYVGSDNGSAAFLNGSADELLLFSYAQNVLDMRYMGTHGTYTFRFNMIIPSDVTSGPTWVRGDGQAMGAAVNVRSEIDDNETGVGASVDDGWSNTQPNYDNGGVAIAIGQNAAGYVYDSWFNFTNVPIPQGVTIDAAYITVTARGSGTDGIGVLTNIYGDDSDDASAPVDRADHVGKSRTTAFVPWDNADFVVDVATNSPGIASVIQEIIDRAGWVAGNALQILWDDNGSPVNKLYDLHSWDFDPARAVSLFVEWSVPLPIPTFTLNITAWSQGISWQSFLNQSGLTVRYNFTLQASREYVLSVDGVEQTPTYTTNADGNMSFSWTDWSSVSFVLRLSTTIQEETYSWLLTYGPSWATLLTGTAIIGLIFYSFWIGIKKQKKSGKIWKFMPRKFR